MVTLSLRRNPIIALLIVSLFLAACNPTITPGPTQATPSQSSATQAPTLAPSPTAPPSLALLIDDGQGDRALAAQVLSTLQEQSSAAGLQVETRPGITAEALTPQVKIVVALPPDPGIDSLAQASPATQFVGINLSGLKPRENLSLIGDGQQNLYRDFLGGYLAALVAEDWRAGVVTQPGDVAGQAALNGGGYLCGTCTPKYPPYERYPLAFEIASPADWQSVVDVAPGKGVKTLYITPQLSTPELLEGLAKAGFNLVSTVTPPEGAKTHWVATVSGDVSASLKTLLPDLVNGKGGASLPANLEITQAASGLLTPGRLNHANLIAQDLSAGLILPTNPPQ